MASESVYEMFRFNEGGGTYDAFTNLIFPFPDECIAKGLMDFNIDYRNDLFDYLRDRGVKKVRYEHKGKRKMIKLGDK
jgi:hypothetical protein